MTVRVRVFNYEGGCPPCTGDAAEEAVRDAMSDALVKFGVVWEQTVDTWETAAGREVLAMCNYDARRAAELDGGRLCYDCLDAAREDAAERQGDEERESR